MADKAGLSLSVDGESEFKKALKEIGADLKVMNSELKLVTSSFGTNEKSVKSLTATNEVLNKQIEEQSKKVETLEMALDNARTAYGEDAVKTKEWEYQLNLATAELNRQKQQLENNEQSIRDYGQAQVKAARDSEEFKKAQERLKDVFAAVQLAAVAVSAAFLGWGVESVKAAGQMESAEAAFTTMLGSAEKAKVLMADLQKFGAETPFEFPEIQAASRSLLAFGVSAEDVTKELERIGDISSGIGAPIGEIAELYGKAKVQGRLFGEDINQLTGRGIPIIQELAKQFNVSESEVKKLVEQGEVGFPQLQQAFKDMTGEGGKFQGMMQKQSETLPGMWSNMMDTIGQKNVEFGQKLIESLDLKDRFAELITAIQEVDLTPIIEGLDWIIQNADKIAAGAVAIGTGMVTWNVVTTVQALVGAIKAWKTATEGMTVAQQLMNLVMAANPIGIVITAIAALAAGIVFLWHTNEDFRNAVIEIWSNISGSIEEFVDFIKDKFGFLWDSITMGIGAFQKLFEGDFRGFLSGIKDAAATWAGGFLDIGKDLVSGIWAGIKAKADWFLAQVKGFFASIVSAAKKAVGIASPSKVFADIGKNLVLGLEKGWTGSINMTNAKIKSDLSGYGNTTNNSVNNSRKIEQVVNIVADSKLDEIGIVKQLRTQNQMLQMMLEA